MTVEIQLPERFQIEQEIGRGGMAVVYRAHDRHLDRYVAIKVLSANFSNAMGVERFQREIALMAKLVHPGIVALFDSGEIDGRLYYVMPFVAGENLRVRLNRERRMAVEDAVAFAADVSEALAYAHGSGIVHRDVKPENIFTVAGRAVLADFGIAQIVDSAGAAAAHLTSDGMVLGTVAYMSPEQASGSARFDGRSDLYSLGCVLYELLTGDPPFVSEAPLAVLMKHMTELPRPVTELNPGVSPALADIIAKLLEKEPDARPATAADLARALRATRISGETVPAPLQPSQADQLITEGFEAIYYGMGGAGEAARAYLDRAVIYIRRGLELEPRNARGLTALANWHFTMGRVGAAPATEAFARGRELVLDALAADDRCPDVHDSLSKMALYYDDDCHAALRHIERSVALNPKDVEARRFQSVVYKILGRLDAAVQSAKAATTIKPDMPGTWNGLGDALMAAGRNAEAVDALRRAVALQPGYGPALERLEIARARLGEFEAALDTRAARLRLVKQPERADQLIRDGATMGAAAAMRADQEREVAELVKSAETTDPFEPYYLSRTLADRIVMVYAELGEWHKAMDWIERAYAHRPVRLRRMLTEPPFDRRGLAVDPRYTRLLRVAVMEDLM